MWFAQSAVAMKQHMPSHPEPPCHNKQHKTPPHTADLPASPVCSAQWLRDDLIHDLQLNQLRGSDAQRLSRLQQQHGSEKA